MSSTYSKTRLLACTVAASAAVLALAAPASATAPTGHGPKPHNGTFFTGGNGTAGWASGNSVAGDNDGKVISLSSPDGNGYGGFQGQALDGLPIAGITALSYDFAVTTPGWTGGGGGSPRLVVELSDGGNIQLLPVNTLTTGTWVHMDAPSGSVDNVGGTGCGTNQVPWNEALACHANTTVVDAFVVVDSGWLSPITVQVDNVTMNSTVYTKPGKL